MNQPTKFDYLLCDDGPAAIVIREHLIPVEGRDGVVFPPSYAEVGYNIDGQRDGANVCLIDSVGSQANRLEPIFKEQKYNHLVPQVSIKAGEKEINILDAGHRAGDAIVRCTVELQVELQNAFKVVLKGNAEPLAKIAPTSLVFGVWDSRNTQAKLPRLVSSTIRSFNVRELKRRAQYVPAVDYVKAGLLEEPADLRDSEGKVKGTHPFASRGFAHQPVSKPENIRGGVFADGGIRRDATLSLAALKLLRVGEDETKTHALRRYILGLSLTAFTYQSIGYLRQGCLLVLDPQPSTPNEFVEVFPNGTRKPFAITHAEAVAYASEVAAAFEVGANKTVLFDKERAKKDVTGEDDGNQKGRKSNKNKKTE